MHLMGRGDRYLQPRFTVPVSDGGAAPWPLSKTSEGCDHPAARKTFHSASRSWLCEACLADRKKEA